MTNYWTRTDESTTISTSMDWENTTVSTNASSFPNLSNRTNRVTRTRTYSVASTIDHRVENLKKELKRRKELLKRQAIEKMKEDWDINIPIPRIEIRRPSIQLRGVCFSGRGWA